MLVLATYNFKGGVGKTATAVTVSHLAAREGLRVLLWDLDHEAKEEAEKLGLRMARATAANDHPRFITMLGELIRERLEPEGPRAALGTLPARPDRCREGCCPSGRPARRA